MLPRRDLSRTRFRLTAQVIIPHRRDGGFLLFCDRFPNKPAAADLRLADYARSLVARIGARPGYIARVVTFAKNLPPRQSTRSYWSFSDRRERSANYVKA